MTTWVALLRGVNVGGRSVVMAELRAALEAEGLDGVRSYIQSGNLVFRTSETDPAVLAARLTSAARARLGLETDFVVRTAAEWSALIAANPLPEAAADRPARLLLWALPSPPDPERVARLEASIPGREVVRAAGAALYIDYADGIGASKLLPAVLDRGLGVRGTGRNWNTVLKLAEMASA